MTTSIIDQPAMKSEDDDQLKMRAYSDALVEFINGAQTPLTIALQGEWGSGKTSLMNALKRELVDGTDSQFLYVWINTWQYSLMADPNTAIVQIMQGIVDQIPVIDEKHVCVKKRAVNLIGSFLKMSAVAVANAGGKTIGLQDVGSEVLKQLNDEDSTDKDGAAADSAVGRNQIEILKDRIQALVNASTDANKKHGFIFFIDDLDRIDPPVAVQILELLKNVFDLDKCVFVLAIDYGVVVKGLKSKFGEMTVANEREFRSFFDKIIQLPFAMPVGAYCIDKFLMDSLKTIGYITEEQSKDKKLCKTLTDYALESVGTNPRSLKRLINSLSLMRLLVIRTATKQDDFDFEDWKDVVFALECIKIQYPQVHTALERFCGFDQWGSEFAQAMGLQMLSKDESDKLRDSQGENFDEEWEQMLFALCKRDPFLESRALNISLMLNQIRTAIRDRQENVEDMVSILLKLSAVTSVKSEPVMASIAPTFNASELLKALRHETLGMGWRKTEIKKCPYWGVRLSDDVTLCSWQKRVQSNLACELVLSTEKDHIYKGDRWMQFMMRFETNGGQMRLKIWGELWGARFDDKVAKFNLRQPEAMTLLSSVEQTFREAWSQLGEKGNIGHDGAHFWFNVSIPIASLEAVKESALGENLRNAFVTVARSFATLKPFCVR